MERRFRREIKSLDDIFKFIGEFAVFNNVDESEIFTLNFVVEELFTNIVKYNSKEGSDILIDLKRDGNRLIIGLTDFDSEPFDVTKTEEVDIRQSLRQRRVGGLGIHLVKKMVDHMDYNYNNRKSTITLIKNLEK